MRKGTKHTEATKLKMSLAKRGTVLPVSDSLRKSVTQSGRPKTPEHRNNISKGMLALHARKRNAGIEPIRHTVSDEVRQKISEGLRLKHESNRRFKSGPDAE